MQDNIKRGQKSSEYVYPELSFLLSTHFEGQGSLGFLFVCFLFFFLSVMTFLLFP